MNHKVSLSFELGEEITPKQRRLFYDELINRNYKEGVRGPQKWLADFDGLMTEKNIICNLKKEMAQVASNLGINRYSVIAHFEMSNLVIFFSGHIA